MAEWKSLDVLICEYTEAQCRLDEAIARNRARAAETSNIGQRMKLDRACEAMRLERASLTHRIIEMQQIIRERGGQERGVVWPDCDCPGGKGEGCGK